MHFFSDCTSKEEAKKVYRKLALCFHPDKCGSSDLMVELQRQYDDFPQFIRNPNQYYNNLIYTKLNESSLKYEWLRKQYNTISLENSELKSEINDLKNIGILEFIHKWWFKR